MSESSKGLGDSIAKITKATGIEKLVKALVPDCGCDRRQEWLNEKFPYRNRKTKQAVTLTQEQAQRIENLANSMKGQRVDRGQNAELFALHNEILGSGKRATSCSPCVKNALTDLLVIYEQHKPTDK